MSSSADRLIELLNDRPQTSETKEALIRSIMDGVGALNALAKAVMAEETAVVPK